MTFANRSVKFLSGSKDGIVKVWNYRAKTWQPLVLLMYIIHLFILIENWRLAFITVFFFEINIFIKQRSKSNEQQIVQYNGRLEL
jgi:hypothetical protein